MDENYCPPINKDSIRCWFGAYAVLCIWIKMLYWAKWKPDISYYLSQIVEAFKQITSFMFIFLVAILAVANFYVILEMNVLEY